MGKELLGLVGATVWGVHDVAPVSAVWVIRQAAEGAGVVRQNGKA